MSRGVVAGDIFIDDADRREFLAALKRICTTASAEILAYCLMGNHYHLAIMVSNVPLAVIMQRLLTGYARTFNRRHARVGHLFQARYEAKICLDETYLARVIPYIVMNPVRAGLVSKPEDWPWSSLQGKPLTGNYERELADFDPWEKETTVSLLRADPAPSRTLGAIGAEVASQSALQITELRMDDRRRSVIAAKRRFTQTAWREGHKAAEIAKWLNVGKSSVGRYLRDNTGKLGGLTPILS